MLYNDKRRELCGGGPDQTNNTMELTAILEAMRAIVKPDISCIVYSDSQYSIDCVTKWYNKWKRNGWKTSKGKPVKNADLIRAIVHERERFARIEFTWVKGHAGNEGNERADWLATTAKSRFGKTGGRLDSGSGLLDFTKRRQFGE
jgi:ribonuclease HI